MSSPLRLLLLGRRFWPHGSSDSAAHLIDLATGLKRQGVAVEVLTPRYSASWSSAFDFREIPVHRPAIAPRSDWSTGRYMRNLTKWMRENGEHYDLIMVDGAREDAVAALEARRTLNCPVVVRLGHDHLQSDLDWWASSRAAQRCENATRSADAIVVSGSSTQRALVSRGFAPHQIVRIDVGIGTSIRSDEAQRIEARKALASINRDFHAPADEPVVFCVTPMEGIDPKRRIKQVDRLVHAMVVSARDLVARFPLLHLWYIGDGSQRDLIYSTLRGDGVRASIAMPGCFGNMEDVFAAADVYVQMNSFGLEAFLPMAVAAQLPIVAADLPEVREVLALKSSGSNDVQRASVVDASRATEQADRLGDATSLVSWFDPDRPKTFRQAVRHVLDDLPAAEANAEVFHRQLVRTLPQTKVLEDYMVLFQDLMAKHHRSDPGPSMGAVS
ncbi:glycosyltransferase family 4 protein [Planctomycetes bacterium K23_9]|uniref:Glycosyltransferase subfamily 4-like N-terminal domain-containing protein n=1 Tax=Stieleria marina TaxID=1930275 RepID=A0A517P0F4_9BACT|nr:hypothetical protein K239x_48560 [Planctomycetes bacterium K23_9]